MPGRYFTSGTGYRFGFNGKENDNEVKGVGNQQDYGMRIYDTRLGKFLSVDPLTKSYPMLTPYQFASNTPITSIDLDGLEAIQVIDHRTKTTTILTNIIAFDKDDYNTSDGIPKDGVSDKSIDVMKNAIKLYFTNINGKYNDNLGYSINFSIGLKQVYLASQAQKFVNNNPNSATVYYPSEVEETRTDNGVFYLMGATGYQAVMVGDDNEHTAAHEVCHSIVHYSENSKWKEQILDLPNKSWSEQFDYHECFGGIFSYSNKSLPITSSNIDQMLFATKIIEIPQYGPYTQEQTNIIDNISQNEFQIPFVYDKK